MYLFQTNKFYHIFRYFTRGFLWFSFGHNEVSPVNVTFLSPNKKVTKEIGTGKALYVVLSTRHGFAHRTPKPPFPVYPSRPHSVSAEELNPETRHSKNVPIFAALRWYTKKRRQSRRAEPPANVFLCHLACTAVKKLGSYGDAHGRGT